MQSPRDLREWQKAVERNIAAAKGGARMAVAHADKKDETIREEVEDFKLLTPAAPVELVYQTETYIDAAKRRRGKVTVDFPDVVFSTTGKAIGVYAYELAGQDQGENPLGKFRTLGTASDSTITVADLNPGSTWKFKVRAMSGSTVKAGLWSSESTVQIVVDTTPPPQPSTPVITTSGGYIKAEWDGLAAGGGTMPGDFERLEVAFGMASSPTTVIDTFYSKSFAIIPKVNYNAPHYVRFRAFDFSGNASAWSAQASGIPVPLVDVDVILAHIDAAQTQITNITEASIKSGAILSRHLSENSVSQAALQDQIISLAKMDTSANAKIQQGIDDAFTAQTAALGADSKAGTAQTAANAAQAKADAAAEAAITGNAYSLNPSFDDWTGALPAYHIAWTNGPTKATNIVKRGTVSARFNVTDAADYGLNWNGILSHAPNLEYFTIECQFYLASGTTLSGASILLDWVGMTGGNRAEIHLKDEFPSPQTGKWYTLIKTVRRPAGATGTWTGMDGYLIANWTSAGSGGKAVKDIYFDWLNIRPASVEEIQSYGAPTLISAAQAAANAAQAKADSAFADAQTALTNAGLAQTAANGKNSNYYSASAPSGSGFKVNDTWFRSSDNKVHRWDGAAWIAIADTAIAAAQTAANDAATAASTADGKAVTAQTKANKAETDAAAAKTAGDNAAILANSIVKTATTAATGTPPSVGALWNQTNADGSLIIKTWTANAAGTAWVERKLDDAVIGNLNAATINAGIINAARFNAADIRAKFIEAGKITAGDIVTGTLTSASGVFGTIDANIINAGTLNAARLNAGDVRAKFLAAGLIQAVDMVTGTITANSGVIGSLDIGKVTTGKLNGVYIEAKTLKTEHLLITDLTSFAPSLAESPGDWILTNDMQIVDTSLDPTGKRFNVSNPTVASRAYGPTMAVKPGEKLWGGATLYRGSGTLTAYLRYEFMDGNKVGLAGGVGVNYVDLGLSATSGGTGTRWEGAATVPAGAAYARWYIIFGSGTGSAGFYNIEGRRQTGAVYIADGAVTADKVVANTFTAKHLVIGDFTNLAIGSDFEDANAIPWALHANHARTTSQKKSGSYSLRLASSGSTSESTLVADTTVKEGEQWYIKAWAYIDASFNGSSGGSKIRVGNQSGTFIAAAEFATQAKSSWQLIETVATIPAGATSMKVTINSDHTAGYAYLDDIQVRRMSEASLIQNLGVEKLTASTASINVAVIDKLWTDVVRSRSITTDMLNVGRGDNWIAWNVKNVPSSYLPHSPMNGSTLSFMTDATHSGKTSLYATGTTVPNSTWTQFMRLNSGYTSDNGQSNHWNAVQDGKLVIEAWFRAGGTYTNGVPKVRFQIAFAKTDGAWHSTVYSSEMLTDFTWKKLSHEFSVPSAAASIYIYVQQDQPGGMRIDDPFMAPQYQASLISAGAIIAPHLTVTEEMWAKVIKFKLLSGDEIDVNSLTSNTGWIGTLRGGVLINDVVDTGIIKADAITSKHTITGATIQTTATANRGIKITSSDLRAWNGTGTETFSIIGSTGAVTATGQFRTGTSGNYIDILGTANGGMARFYTGNGSGRGSIWARDDGNPRMSLSFGNVDEPTGTLPVVVLKTGEAYMNYGSRTIKVWNNAGSEELLLDATDASVVLRGNLDMRSGRIQVRYGSAAPLGYIGQAPASGSSPDMEVRADTGSLRLVGLIKTLSTYNSTTTMGSNVVVSSSGDLMRSTSASRYKADQREMSVPASVLDVKLKDWIDKEALVRKEELEALPRPMLESQAQEYASLQLQRIPGMIAEDVEAAGGEPYVIYGADGQTEGIMYDRFALAQIAALLARLEAAEGRIADLEAAAPH